MRSAKWCVTAQIRLARCDNASADQNNRLYRIAVNQRAKWQVRQRNSKDNRGNRQGRSSRIGTELGFEDGQHRLSDVDNGKGAGHESKN